MTDPRPTAAAQPAAPPRQRRPARSQAVLTVQERQWVSPGLVRIVAGGPGFADYQDNDFTDKYVKLLFADPAHGLRPPYDLDHLRRTAPEQLPARRTYTVRWARPETQQLAIDFVVHGDEGVAGPWAAAATPGDTLVLTGAGGAYRPDPQADWHLLIGDLAALPAIASALEALPAHATGHVLACTDDAADWIDLPRPDGVELHWLKPDGADDPLVRATHNLVFPAGRPQAFVHGERSTVKALRRHLVGERQLARESLSISAYWAKGRIEDQFQAEKREPIGQLD